MSEGSPPTFVEPVVGFRAWKLTPDGKLLPRAVSAMARLHAEPWQPGVNDARCMYVGFTREPHPVPGEGCDCGLYAHHDAAELRRYHRGDDVLGAIVGWGDLQVHDNGFRAQHAQVVALVAPTSGALVEPARLAAERYGVPLVPGAALAECAAASGSPLPADVTPTRSRRRRPLRRLLQDVVSRD